MSPKQKKIKVFVASPSDVQRERNLVERVITRLNREVSNALGVVLEVVRWETHTVPNMGRPQSIVNPLVDQCDIFVGILWHRFGSTPGTSSSGVTFSSGTEEEFRQALTRWNLNGAQSYSLPRIMLYFSSRPVRTSEIDLNQTIKVKAFKQEFFPGGRHPGFVRNYNSLQEFEALLHQHLLQVIFDLSGGVSRGEVISDFVNIPVDDWNDLFRESNFGFFLLMYSYTWRNTYLQQLRDVIRRGGKLRFILPLPTDDNKALPLMANRIGTTLDELKNRISKAVDDLNNLKSVVHSCVKAVEIRYTRMYLNHAFYLFEKGGIIALYSYKTDRSPSPAILLVPGLLYDESLAEFSFLFDEAQENF